MYVLLIRICLLYVHFVLNERNAQEMVCANEQFVLRVIILMSLHFVLYDIYAINEVNLTWWGLGLV